ncbi:MAG TPA: aquaporin [Candidatus Acidoferrum sp.]|jgi:glycerol uptake facilitator-like aquaporin|nr:aquaporin [Candidatus Acidoferrum sp.]
MAKGSGMQSAPLELFATEALPGDGYSLEEVLLGEVITTFGLVAGLCVFLGFRKLRPFTPWAFPFPYALMVYVQAPISGTSTNPARSLGPSIVSGPWQGWWLLDWSADWYFPGTNRLYRLGCSYRGC